MTYGLLINYEYCTGCHSCEVACKTEHDLPLGQYGIHVLQDGPRRNVSGGWDYDYLPLPTRQCDLCAERTESGRMPTCVHHCQSGVMYYDTIENLAKRQVDMPRSVLYNPR